MNKKNIITSVGIGVLIGVILASGVAVAKISLHGKFPAGTEVGGVDISHKAPAEAVEILGKKKEEYLKTPIRIKILEEKKEILPEELGMEILTEETIATIRESDARNFGLINIIMNSASGAKKHEPVVVVNFEKMKQTLEENFEIGEIAPKQATFFFDDTRRLAIKEEEKGVELNKAELARTIRERGKEFSSEEIEVEAKEVYPEITAEKLEKQREKIEQALNQRTTLIDPVYRDNWYLRLIDNIDWVEFEPAKLTELPILQTQEEQTKVEIRIKQEKLDEYIDAHISRWLDREAEDVNIYRDEDGKIIIEGTGSDGKRIDRKMMKEALELAVQNGITEITVPVLHINPEITVDEELTELGIKERLGVGHSSYYGSPWNRVHNIKVSAERFNGQLIAPDEVFSFNQDLGPVNAATGHRKELVIKPEGTIPEYGGGICQTSTTLFRAILLSGLEVVERHPHSYAVTYYSQVMGHGMDATVYLGGPDLKFKNDTENHVLIQAYVKDNYELYMVFYGTDDGRSVEMKGPFLGNYRNPGPTVYQETNTLPPGHTKQVEKNHVGFRADWKRIITRADGTKTEEDILTNYRAIPARILVGAGEKTEE